jgi:hypothetical protein
MTGIADFVTGIDHTMIAVADLDRAAAAYRRLGFTATPPGRHPGRGTANICFMFPHDYVELIGASPGAESATGLEAFLASHGEGLRAVALAGDATEVAAELTPRGLASGPFEISRTLELPQGVVEPRFRLTRLEERATPGLTAFLCQHLTPELMRRPEWLTHANGAMGIDGVTLAVNETDLLTPSYAALFGDHGVRRREDGFDVTIGSHSLRFLEPRRLARRYPGLVMNKPLPFVAALTLISADLSATRSYLVRNGVRIADAPGDRIVLMPEQACGVILEFVDPGG